MGLRSQVIRVVRRIFQLVLLEDLNLALSMSIPATNDCYLQYEKLVKGIAGIEQFKSLSEQTNLIYLYGQNRYLQNTSGAVKFQERISSLSLHNSAIRRETNISREKEGRQSVLIVSALFPSHKHAGGLRLFDIIQSLSKNYDIDLYSRFDEKLDREALQKLEKNFRSLRIVEGRKFNLKDAKRWLERKGCSENEYNVIQFEYPDSIDLISGLSHYGYKTCFTLMECATRRYAIRLEELFSENKLDQEYSECAMNFIESLSQERRAISLVDESIAITDEDADFCEKISGKRPAVVATGVSSLIIKQAESGSLSTEFSDLNQSAVFIGYFDHLPNVDAVQWYMRNIHPRVLKVIPDFKIYIVGGGDISILKHELGAMEGVSFSGWVENLVEWVSKGSICVSPLISGAGFRGKINQYSVFKRPTVSTSIGTSGIEYKDGESVLVADDPQEFADAVVELSTQKETWNKIYKGSQSVLEKYQWPNLIKKIEELYEA